MEIVSLPVDYTLYLVTDRKLAASRSFDDIVRQAVEGGVTLVQLREKELSTRDFVRFAIGLRNLLHECRIPMIVNDRLDVALACGAAGVHLGQDDMDCGIVRAIAGRRLIIGVSVNGVDEAVRAEAQGADYLAVSPVFDTPTKTDTPAAVGLDGLRAIRKAVMLPLVAIGGVKAENAAEVVRAGADGLAVVSAIMANPEPKTAAQALKAAITEARAQSPSDRKP
jgi:thiamine-phosphate pyrophosphorylase